MWDGAATYFKPSLPFDPLPPRLVGDSPTTLCFDPSN